MSRPDRIRRYYERRIAPRRKSFDVLDWASPDSQLRRFEVLVEQVPLDGRKLLDVGCGLGDLWAFLKQRDINVDYTGVDLLEKMAAEARRRHPDIDLKVANVFEDSQALDGRFDVAFASGIFNLNLGNNLEFVTQTAVPRMMQLASGWVVFNMLHSRELFESHRYFYADPAEVTALLAHTGWRMRVIDDYLPNDFTVICTPPQ